MHPSLLHKPLNVMCTRRFFCSELVAQMLVHAGQVKLKRNLDFFAQQQDAWPCPGCTCHRNLPSSWVCSS